MDITNVSYLIFRMAPFIIVCFFILQSLLNWDLKGIIYLAGLMFSTVAICLLSGPMDSLFLNKSTSTKIDDVTSGSVKNLSFSEKLSAKCKIITLGSNGGLLSNIPLSIGVYSYTFFYMLIFILNLGNRTDNKGVLGASWSKVDLNSALQQNIPTLILFPLLCGLEIFWITLNNCSPEPLLYITCALIVGAFFGTLWAVMITSLKNNDLMYLSKSGVEVCSRPSKTYFSCKKQPGSAKKSTGLAS